MRSIDQVVPSYLVTRIALQDAEQLRLSRVEVAAVVKLEGFIVFGPSFLLQRSYLGLVGVEDLV